MAKQINSLALGFLLVPSILGAIDKQEVKNRWPEYEELLEKLPTRFQEKYAKLSDEQKAALFALYQDVSRLMVIADDIKERHKDALTLLHELGLHGKMSCSLSDEQEEKA